MSPRFRFSRLLKNYCACQYGVKILLKILIYRHKLRFFVEFCLAQILALACAHDVFQQPVRPSIAVTGMVFSLRVAVKT